MSQTAVDVSPVVPFEAPALSYDAAPVHVAVAVLAMLAVLTLTAGSTASVAVLAPMIGPEANLAPTTIGVFVAISSVVAGICGLLSSMAIARLGPVRVLQMAVLSACLGLALITLASPVSLIGGAILLGFATGPYNPASAQILYGLTSSRWQPFVFSAKQTGVPLGGMLIGAVIPFVALTFGWRAGALSIALVGLFICAGLHGLRETYASPSDPSLRARSVRRSLIDPVRLVLLDRPLRWLTFAASAYSSAQLSFVAFHVVYLTEAAGRSIIDAGFAFACLQAGGVAGRILWGLVAGHIATPATVLVVLGLGSVGGLIGLTAIDATWSLPAVAMLSTALGLTGMGWNGVLLAEVATRAPKGQVADATGGLQLLMFLGAVVAPPGFTLIVATAGYAAAYLSLAGVIAFGVFFTARVWLTYPRSDR